MSGKNFNFLRYLKFMIHLPVCMHVLLKRMLAQRVKGRNFCCTTGASKFPKADFRSLYQMVFLREYTFSFFPPRFFMAKISL